MSKEDPRGAAEPATRYPFVADIVGNTICADLLDYLPRDHYYTGLPAKLGDRFVSGFYVTRSDHPYYPRRMAMRITRAGRDRDDAVSELFKYLRYRYELSERALVHHAKVAADAMVGKALEMWSDATWIAEALKIHPDLVKASVADIDETRRAITGSAPSTVADIDRATRDRLEAELLRHGDDGLLEHLLYSAEKESSTDKRLAGVVSLTTGLLYRKLFKRSGLCRSARPNAARIYKTHGSPAARRRLEREAAKYAGLDHSWQVLVWIPDPDMRLKAAEVLVDDARTVCPLVDLDNVGSNRGREIYESHKALWAVSVFVHPSVSPERRSVLLGRLSERIGGIKWDNLKDQPSVTRLAAYRVGAERKLARVDENMLAEQAEGLAARKGGATFEDLVRELHQVAEMRWSKGERLS